MAEPDAAALDVARVRIAAAAKVCVLTGAGMSAESGIPTFRDARARTPETPAASSLQGGAVDPGAARRSTGLWAQFDPQQLASEEGFRADPPRVWQWYAKRRAAVLRAQPNAGHHALAAFERARPDVLTLVSQNVDDLHQRAGNRATIRLHGDILADRWLDPCPRGKCGKPCDTDSAAPGTPPRCAECGHLVRPDVVWFGEMLPAGAIAAAEAAARACDVMLVVGTSGAVWPAAGLAARARRSGAHVVIVNPQASEIDAEAHVLLPGTAAGVLPRILRGGA